jgi:DNA-binding PadR family transcriptional regulator
MAVAYRPNATAASLLGFLLDGPLTGWDLVRTVQRRLGDLWSITRSQVYRELLVMEREGLVEAGPTGQRERRPFMITEHGRDAFAAWASVTPDDETTRIPLLVVVAFGRHVPSATLERHLAAHRGIHEERLARYEADKQLVRKSWPLDGHTLATLAFGIGYERAVLAWFDDLPRLIGVDTASRNRKGGA